MSSKKRKICLSMICDFTCITILLLMSILALRGTLSNPGLILIHDYSMPLPTFPDSVFYTYLWNHKSNTGISNLPIPMGIPFAVLITFLSHFISFWLLNRAMFILPLFITGLGVYILLRVHQRNKISSLLAGIFAMYNPTVVSRLIYGQVTLVTQVGILAVFFALYYLLSKKNCSELNTAFWLSIVTVIVATIGGIIPLTFLVALFLLYVTLEIIFDQKIIKRKIKLVVFYATITALLNFWWILPTFYSMLAQGGQFYTVKESYAQGILTGTSSASSFTKAFLLYSQDVEKRVPYYNNDYLRAELILLIVFAVIFMKKDLLSAFSLSVFTISIIFFQGVNPPFGKLYLFLYNNFPGFFIYRDVHHFDILLLLSYSLIFGSGLNEFIKKVTTKSRFSKIILPFVITLLLFLLYAYGHPLFEGKLITPVKVPDYYFEVISFLKNESTTYRVFYPFRNYLTAYKWSRFELVNVFFSSPYFPPIVSYEDAISVTTLPEYARSVIAEISELFRKSDNSSSKALGMLSVKYIITDSADNIGNSMGSKNLTGITLYKVFGTVYVYKNIDALPIIYACRNLIYTSIPISDLRSIVSSAQFNEDSVIVSRTQIRSNEIPENVSFNSKVEIKIISCTPVRYEVKVNSTGPFLLVFTETFNDGWIAYSGNRVFTHFIANYYANGWYVDKVGNYTITIEFKPQVLLFYGSSITLLTFVLLLTCILLLHALKRFYKIRRTS